MITNCKKIFLPLVVFSILTAAAQEKSYDQQTIYKSKFDDAIPVLNVASFHFGETSDASSTEFDEHSEENKKQIHKVARLLADFKPTIIVIEDLPINNKQRLADYLDYCKHPKKTYKSL